MVSVYAAPVTPDFPDRRTGLRPSHRHSWLQYPLVAEFTFNFGDTTDDINGVLKDSRPYSTVGEAINPKSVPYRDRRR